MKTMLHQMANRTIIVTTEQLANQVGSGQVAVFATPMMIALIEQTASECIQPYLADGETSVGTFLSVTHSAATPKGMAVTAQVEVIEVNGREVVFHVQAKDEVGLIGEGLHKRFIVNKDKFEQKAQNTAKK